MRDADVRLSRRRARSTAWERVRDARVCLRRAPFRESRSACRRIFAETVPFLGGGNFTPARLALERPMAMACLMFRAPWIPSRTCSISSRTNSPACVEGALPFFASSRARRTTSDSAIATPRLEFPFLIPPGQTAIYTSTVSTYNAAAHFIQDRVFRAAGGISNPKPTSLQ